MAVTTAARWSAVHTSTPASFILPIYAPPEPPSAIPTGKPVSFQKCILKACIGFNATLAGSITISKGVLTGLSTPTATIKSVTCGPSSGLVRQHGLASTAGQLCSFFHI